MVIIIIKGSKFENEVGELFGELSKGKFLEVIGEVFL